MSGSKYVKTDGYCKVHFGSQSVMIDGLNFLSLKPVVLSYLFFFYDRMKPLLFCSSFAKNIIILSATY